MSCGKCSACGEESELVAFYVGDPNLPICQLCDDALYAEDSGDEDGDEEDFEAAADDPGEEWYREYDEERAELKRRP